MIALLFFLAAEILDFEMGAQEQKKTGMTKLNAKEKSALYQWIDSNYEKRTEPLAQQIAPRKRPIIEENLQNGSYIRLSDGTLWSIRPADVPIVLGWITPVEIIVGPSGDAGYPYKLTNSLTGSSVLAKKVNAVEPEKEKKN